MIRKSNKTPIKELEKHCKSFFYHPDGKKRDKPSNLVTGYNITTPSRGPSLVDATSELVANNTNGYKPTHNF